MVLDLLQNPEDITGAEAGCPTECQDHNTRDNSSRTSTASSRTKSHTLVIRRVASSTGSIAFYGLSYTPFCISLLLHVAVTSCSIDPNTWTVNKMKRYWCAAIAVYCALLAYSVGAPFIWRDHGTDAGMGPMIWPILVPTVVFHILTIRYAHLRPELTRVTVTGRKLRWKYPRNWLGLAIVLIEFAQILSIPFSGNIPWLPEQTGSSAFVRILESIFRTFVVFSQNEVTNLVFSMVIVGLFAFLIGEFIHSKRGANDPMAAVLYELLSGGLFLTTLGSMLRMARVTVLARRQVAVLIGLLLYTTPSVFVSIYRGDLRVVRADINYAPVLLARERLAKEIFAITAVYILAPEDAIGLLISAIILGITLLWIFWNQEQFSCPTVVNARRLCISIATWSSVCGLFVVTNHSTVGRVLLCIGWSGLLLVLLFQLFKRCWWRWLGDDINSVIISNDIDDEGGSEEVGEGDASSLSVLNDKIEAPYYHPQLHFLSGGDTVVNQEMNSHQGRDKRTESPANVKDITASGDVEISLGEGVAP